MTKHATLAQDSTPRRPGAESFFLPGGSSGVLLLHGFSGTPGELRPLAEALAQVGYTVYAPLLPGHGGSPAELNGVRWADWAQTADAGLRRLHETCDTVVVGGLSMGALLALRLAAHAPVAGVIAMAPALRLIGQRQLEWTGLAKYVLRWFAPLQKADFSDPSVRANVRQWVPDADLDDPAVVARIRQEARLPVAALHELVRLQRHVRHELPAVRAPLLVMQGRKDGTVDLRGVDELLAQVGTADKRVLWFEESGHVLPQEHEHAAVAAAAVAWLDETTKRHQPGV